MSIKVFPTTSRCLVHKETGVRRWEDWIDGKWVLREIDNVSPVSTPFLDLISSKAK